MTEGIGTAQGQYQEVRAVFFDLYNTLARFWPPREQVQAGVCTELGLEVGPSGLMKGYAAADAYLAQENARWPIRARSPEEALAFWARYEQLVLLGAGLEVGEALAAKVWQRVRQQRYDLVLFEDVLLSLDRLKAAGIVLGVLSNINRDGAKLSDSLGLAGHINFLVTSQEVGSEKPHPPMFLVALERAGVQAGQVLHVGDQWDSDVVGAQGVGIRAVLMDRYGAARERQGIATVHNMAELEALLGLTQ
ncbi:MAG: HAD family hydrolase [Chloroflexi bacterium]|nr:HAD family hydrolase [Chloroflexota bacterium]